MSSMPCTVFSYLLLSPSEPRIVTLGRGVMSSPSGFAQLVLVYAPGTIFSAALSLRLLLCGSHCRLQR